MRRGASRRRHPYGESLDCNAFYDSAHFRDRFSQGNRRRYIERAARYPSLRGLITDDELAPYRYPRGQHKDCIWCAKRRAFEDERAARPRLGMRCVTSRRCQLKRRSERP